MFGDRPGWRHETQPNVSGQVTVEEVKRFRKGIALGRHRRQPRALHNKAVHIALGVRADGNKEILGLWLERNEGPNSGCVMS